jgi:NAD(P)-dependent dehydrogenase (short-subunit alcohol dehydrogenase family)
MMAGILKTFGDVIQSSTLFQRIGEVEDIVGVCIYLSSKAAEWVTGVVIPIDGGILIKPSL